MSTGHTLRCYDYVNQPFEKVEAMLRADAASIFAQATSSAAARERAIGVQLHAKLAMLDVSTDVRVKVGPLERTMSSPLGYEIAIFPLTWSAASSPSLFPSMQAKLSVFPLSRGITQVELEGTYDPPLGLLGDAIDAVLGHRIAEASVLQFVRDLCAYLRAEMAAHSPDDPTLR